MIIGDIGNRQRNVKKSKFFSLTMLNPTLLDYECINTAYGKFFVLSVSCFAYKVIWMKEQEDVEVIVAFWQFSPISKHFVNVWRSSKCSILWISCCSATVYFRYLCAPRSLRIFLFGVNPLLTVKCFSYFPICTALHELCKRSCKIDLESDFTIVRILFQINDH